MPVEQTCTLCGASQSCVNTKTCNDIASGKDWIPHPKEIIISEAWDEELYCIGDSLKFDENNNAIPIPDGTLIDTIYHPTYSNEEVEYLENIKTGEKLYVELTSCRHVEWKADYSSGNLGPDFHYCASCGIKKEFAY